MDSSHTPVLELTQAGLPLVDNPWAWIGEQLSLDEHAVLDLLRQLQNDGAIRRIAAVPNLYHLGYRQNGAATNHGPPL